MMLESLRNQCFYTVLIFLRKGFSLAERNCFQLSEDPSPLAYWSSTMAVSLNICWKPVLILTHQASGQNISDNHRLFSYSLQSQLDSTRHFEGSLWYWQGTALTCLHTPGLLSDSVDLGLHCDCSCILVRTLWATACDIRLLHVHLWMPLTLQCEENSVAEGRASFL